MSEKSTGKNKWEKGLLHRSYLITNYNGRSNSFVVFHLTSKGKYLHEKLSRGRVVIVGQGSFSSLKSLSCHFFLFQMTSKQMEYAFAYSVCFKRLTIFLSLVDFTDGPFQRINRLTVRSVGGRPCDSGFFDDCSENLNFPFERVQINESGE